MFFGGRWSDFITKLLGQKKILIKEKKEDMINPYPITALLTFCFIISVYASVLEAGTTNLLCKIKTPERFYICISSSQILTLSKYFRDGFWSLSTPKYRVKMAAKK